MQSLFFEILMKLAEMTNFIESKAIYIWLAIVIISFLILVFKAWNAPLFIESDFEDWGE